MKKILLFIIIIGSCTAYSAQEYIFGKILSEDEREMRDVTIVNINTQITTSSNADGNFMIFAKPGDEIRFTKDNFARVSKKITLENISSSFKVKLKQIIYDIEEVEIKYKLTGDLKKDADRFGKPKEMVKMETELGKYISQKSAPGLLKAKPGEFVQPVGPGFSVGGVHAQWDDIDLNEDLNAFFTNAFFVEELNLKPMEISNFIFYVLKNFDRADILQKGRCENSDYVRFREEAFRKIKNYKENLPNDSKDKAKKLQLKDKHLNKGLWW